MKTVFLILACATVVASQSCAAQEGHRGVAVWHSDDDTDDAGWLGVSVQDMTPRLARSMEVETKTGALVNDVVDGSPAEEAGIKDEDIIVEFDGTRIDDSEELVDRVRGQKPGAEVSLVLMRGAERKDLRVTLGTRERGHVFGFAPMPPMPPRIHVFMNHSTLGMEVQEIGKQLAEYFGAPENEGVLVTEVDEEGPARRAGLKAGDIILKVGSQTVREPDDIWDEVEEYKKGDTVDLLVLRDKSRTTLSMEIEEQTGMHWFKGPKSDMRFDFDFDTEFDHESLRDIEREIERQNGRLQPEIEQLRIRLRDLGRTIREWGECLRDRIRSIEWVNS